MVPGGTVRPLRYIFHIYIIYYSILRPQPHLEQFRNIPKLFLNSSGRTLKEFQQGWGHVIRCSTGERIKNAGVETLSDVLQYPRIRGPKIPKISPRMFRTKIVHTSEIFFDLGGGSIFRFWGSKNIFNLCSHIELNTQNPNPIFKITICFTKTPTTPTYFRFFGFLGNFWKI